MKESQNRANTGKTNSKPGVIPCFSLIFVLILSRRNVPKWRNWQTHTTQNRAGSAHVGSTPTFGTKAITTGFLRPSLKTHFYYTTISQKCHFGRFSERTDENQLQLFNEADAECKPSAPEPIMEEITYRRPKQKGKRDERLKDCR